MVSQTGKVSVMLKCGSLFWDFADAAYFGFGGIGRRWPDMLDFVLIPGNSVLSSLGLRSTGQFPSAGPVSDVCGWRRPVKMFDRNSGNSHLFVRL